MRKMVLMVVVLAMGAAASGATLTATLIPSNGGVAAAGEQFTVDIWLKTDTELGISDVSLDILSAGDGDTVPAPNGPYCTVTWNAAVLSTYSPLTIPGNPLDGDGDGDADTCALSLGLLANVAPGLGTGDGTMIGTITYTCVTGVPDVLTPSLDLTSRYWADGSTKAEFDSFQAVPCNVNLPEPATLGLLGLGVLGLLRRR